MEEKLKKVQRNHFLRVCWAIFKFMLFLLAASTLIALLNLLLFKSDTFVMIMGILNGLMVYTILRQDMIEEDKKLEEELKKIRE